MLMCDLWCVVVLCECFVSLLVCVSVWGFKCVLLYVMYCAALYGLCVAVFCVCVFVDVYVCCL